MSTAPGLSLTETDDPLRYAFVEMLFALAISQVAVHAADLTTVRWDSVRDVAAAWIHLALSLLVIGASWIGWRQSQSPGIKAQIESIFSRRAVGLLLDVILVILYFVLVRSVELQQENGVVTLTTPSASNDALWISSIFAVYVVWDLFADVFAPESLTDKGPRMLWQGVRVALASAAASGICLLMALFVFTRATNVSDPVRVALYDGSLIALVLFFRAAKVFEKPLADVLGVGACKAFASPRISAKRPFRLAMTLLLAGVIFLAMAENWVSLAAAIPR